MAIKAAVAVLVSVGSGWALAATTGVLPNPLSPRDEPGPSTVVSPGLPTGAGRPNDASPTPPTSHSAADWIGQCQTLLDATSAQHARLLDSPAMAELVAAAQGKPEVDAFCGTVLKQASPNPTAPRDTAGPTPTGGPGPTGTEPPHTTGPPSSQPSRNAKAD